MTYNISSAKCFGNKELIETYFDVFVKYNVLFNNEPLDKSILELDEYENFGFFRHNVTIEINDLESFNSFIEDVDCPVIVSENSIKLYDGYLD